MNAPVPHFSHTTIQPMRVTRVRFLPILLLCAVAAGTLIGMYYVARAAGWFQTHVDVPIEPPQRGVQRVQSRIIYPLQTAVLPATNGHISPPTPTSQPRPVVQPRAMPARPAAKPTPKVYSARPEMIINKEVTPAPGARQYTLPIWTKIPCQIEPVISSEIPGMFTMIVRRPVMDHTQMVTLIPQGAIVGGKADSASLLQNNERIPMFALSMRGKDGKGVALGNFPITDASGTLGLTGDVNNHTLRWVLGAIFSEGLDIGRQVIDQSLATSGADITVSGVGQTTANTGKQLIGRGMDTRPTIVANAGEKCLILTTEALQLPAAY